MSGGDFMSWFVKEIYNVVSQIHSQKAVAWPTFTLILIYSSNSYYYFTFVIYHIVCKFLLNRSGHCINNHYAFSIFN